jgi:DNA-binding transcriptional ArsR family regulator
MSSQYHQHVAGTAAKRPRRARRRPEDDVRVDQPGALRALAHPARLIAVDELYQGVERTASELAELAGLTPSAMSYHLRALERWGIIERGEAREDGRERPWRASGRGLSVVSDASSPSGVAATDVIVGGYLQQLRDEFRRWSLVESDEKKAWREISGGRRSFLWLTEEEAAAFSTEMKAVMDKYIADRDAVHHPDDARRLVCLLAIVPTAGGATQP